MNGKFLKFLVVAALLVLVVSVLPAGAQEGGEFTLTVLHTNDVHARIDEFDKRGNTCDEDEKAESKCFGGVARRQTMVEQIRSEAPNVILVDGGDQFQGTLFYTQYKGGAAQEMMNALGYDAMAVGNHEFDDGPGALGSFIRGANFPVLSANIDDSAEPELNGAIQAYTVLDVNGQKVGVVGLTTEDAEILSSPGPNVKFNNIEENVQAAVDELTAQGVNKIVAVSHAGFGKDQEVAAAVTGLDVIVAGHTNTYLSNDDEDASGPYPTVVEGPDGNPVLLVSDFTWGKYLGRLDATFDENGVVTSYDGNPILLDSSVEQDAAIQARVQALAAPIEELVNTPVGFAAVDLDGDRTNCRFGECTLGNLITDAIIWKTAGEGVQIAFQNGGGIRASIPAGEVTLGDVLTVLPFGNLISTFELTGAEVVEALENGVSRAENPDNEGTGRFAQVSGVRYSWNPNQPVGARIVSAEVKNDDGSYSPIDMAATYKVAANNFNRGGGDDYQVFVTARNAYDAGAALDEAVAEYIAINSPVAPKLEGRISQAEGEMMAKGEGEMMAEGGTCDQNYVVQADDWLSKIADKFYGDVLAYNVIFEATNAAAAAGEAYDVIADPNVIEVGQVLCIPAREEGEMMEVGDEAAAEEESHDNAHGETPHWTYSGETGPEFWGDLSEEFARCSAGTSQSPIDIASGSATKAGGITFNYQPTSLGSVENNGHTIQVNYDSGSTIEVDGKTFNLAQFHFHAPSEHTQGGAPAAMEMHLVHKSADDKLAVVGVMFDEGEENAFLAQFWGQIPTEKAKVALEGTINAADALALESPYYAYSGSLTTPPCSEDVNWFVVEQRGQVSSEQVAAFSSIIGANARPVQPLNGRVISE